MKVLATEECVGMVLCQDITQIIPGEFKGVLFKKGHIVRAEDVPELLKVGKEHLYVWEYDETKIHENDAAMQLAEITGGTNTRYDEPVEGKSTLFATCRGLFTVNEAKLLDMNMLDMVTLASLPTNYQVELGQRLAGVRIVPLVGEVQTIKDVEAVADGEKIFNVLPYKKLNVGIVTTGSEVYKGRIEDKFGPVMKKKIKFFGGKCLGQTFCLDDIDMIREAIFAFKEKGADFVILTGGMSVDPDDLTPGAIKSTGAEMATYGVPVQPGNMLALGYLDGMVLAGVPGCAMYCHTTILDVILPRIFAGVKLTKRDFAAMGAGGMCRNCKECKYPICYFCR